MSKVVNITGGPRYDDVTFLLCNPRSRSAWLREVLAHVMPCTPHDMLRFCSSTADMKTMIDDAREHGSPLFVADTAAILLFERIRDEFPGANFMFVYRAPGDVDRSIRALGTRPVFEPAKIATKMLRVYQDLRRQYERPMWFTFDRLSDYFVHDMMCERMGVKPLDRTRFEQLAATNIQADLALYASQSSALRTFQLAAEFQL